MKTVIRSAKLDLTFQTNDGPVHALTAQQPVQRIGVQRIGV